MIPIEEIRAAETRLSDKIIRTPCVTSVGLSEEIDREVVLKLENLQKGGSFKVRGVLNKLLSLSETERCRELVAGSGGNFGIAMAEVCKALDIKLTIVMPETTPEASAQRIIDYGARVIIEPNVVTAIARVNALAEQGYLLVDDADDPLICAGGGTIALEMIEDRPDITDVFAAVGGGSMISGVASAFKAVKPDIRIWGVETIGSDSTARALEAGHPVKIDVASVIVYFGRSNHR